MLSSRFAAPLGPGLVLASLLACPGYAEGLKADLLNIPVANDEASLACADPSVGEPVAVTVARAYARRSGVCAPREDRRAVVQGSGSAYLLYNLTPRGDLATPESAAKAIRDLPKANRGSTFLSVSGAGFKRHDNYVTRAEVEYGYRIDPKRMTIVVPSDEVRQALKTSREWISDPDRLATGGSSTLVTCQGGVSFCTVSVPVCQGIFVRFTTPAVDDPTPLAGDILAEYATAHAMLAPICGG